MKGKTKFELLICAGLGAYLFTAFAFAFINPSISLAMVVGLFGLLIAIFLGLIDNNSKGSK